MIELLALPDWQASPTTLDDWVAELARRGGSVVVTRESAGVSWLELASLRVRGYAVLEGSRVEAINFELGGPDAAPAAALIEDAARTLGWDVHPDEPGDDDLEEDDD